MNHIRKQYGWRCVFYPFLYVTMWLLIHSAVVLGAFGFTSFYFKLNDWLKLPKTNGLVFDGDEAAEMGFTDGTADTSEEVLEMN